jgi:hypothetical protein
MVTQRCVWIWVCRAQDRANIYIANELRKLEKDVQAISRAFERCATQRKAEGQRDRTKRRGQRGGKTRANNEQKRGEVILIESVGMWEGEGSEEAYADVAASVAELTASEAVREDA